MTRVSRRGFFTAAATVPLLGACGLDRRSAARIALYDPGLAAGRLFAQRARGPVADDSGEMRCIGKRAIRVELACIDRGYRRSQRQQKHTRSQALRQNAA